MELADRLAALNAVLNGTAAMLLIVGYVLVKRRAFDAHRRVMLAAFGTSAVFLVSYLTRIALSGTHTYPPEAPGRALYLAILASHVLLATTVPVFAIRGIWLGRAKRFAEHRRLMRVGYPIWMYVSVTGVAIYLMLYGALGKL